MPYGHNTDIQSLRAGFFGGGVNITVLAEYGRKRAEYSRLWSHN